jgi:hypothetical protein
MQKTFQNRRTSGAKAIAIDEKVILERYRLYLWISLLFASAIALSLFIILGR